MWQQKRIIEYMNEMPIIQVLIPQIEADDIISYVTQMQHYDGWQKIIVSNDRDFMQLCDDETVLWRPTANEMLNTKRIVETTGSLRQLAYILAIWRLHVQWLVMRPIICLALKAQD
jgi:5'-3' exonuclease